MLVCNDLLQDRLCDSGSDGGSEGDCAAPCSCGCPARVLASPQLLQMIVNSRRSQDLPSGSRASLPLCLFASWPPSRGEVRSSRIWKQPGLVRKGRSVATLGILAATVALEKDHDFHAPGYRTSRIPIPIPRILVKASYVLATTVCSWLLYLSTVRTVLPFYCTHCAYTATLLASHGSQVAARPAPIPQRGLPQIQWRWFAPSLSKASMQPRANEFLSFISPGASNASNAPQCL